MKDKTGGPAFPAIAQMSDQHLRVEWPGMTLRDYFAIHAPPISEALSEYLREKEHAKMLADRMCVYQERGDLALEAEWRYGFADAMLAERARREPDNDG